jgi:hypothetical protein
MVRVDWNQLEALAMDTKHLNQIDLARRWRVSERTLERWRWLKMGPPYLKIGGRVVYQLSQIEAYETTQAKNCGKPTRAAS